MVVVVGLAGVGLEPAIPSRPLPRGDRMFTLGMTRAAFETLATERGIEILSDQAGFLATTSDRDQVEFERYAFLGQGGAKPVLWRATIAYRVPYARPDFALIEAELRALLGDPTEVSEANDHELGRVPSRAVSWTDGITAVQLAGRWPEVQDPRADRMLVTWTDRKMKRAVDAVRKREREPSPSGE